MPVGVFSGAEGEQLVSGRAGAAFTGTSSRPGPGGKDPLTWHPSSHLRVAELCSPVLGSSWGLSLLRKHQDAIFHPSFPTWEKLTHGSTAVQQRHFEWELLPTLHAGY